MEEEVHINAKGNIIDILTKMKAGFEGNSESASAFQDTASKSLSKIEQSLKNVSLAAFQQNLESLNQGFQDLNGPGLTFNTSLKELSALTGTTGADLDKLGEKARASAKEFGGNAAQSLNTYKTILGRLGPSIAEDQVALDAMEKNVQVLSKTMSNDAVGAVDALTTAALQFGVDLTKPKVAAAEMTKMMDVMANAAQEGAAEVPQISAALKVSGVAAKQAKVSFIEANSAIQALAEGGKEGSEAGMALRNVLGKMAGEDVIPKAAAEKLRALGVDMKVVSNTAIPFTDRLRELKKAQGDATVMAQVFGVENAAAANILLDSVDAQDELSKVIGKVGGAQAQANIVMESTAEKLARMQANIDDVKISFFESTGGLTAYLGPLTEVGQTLVSFTPIANMAKSAVMTLATAEGRAGLMTTMSTVAKVGASVATKTITAAQWLWNAALMANPIGLVIGAVALLAAGVYAASKAFDKSTASQKINAEVTKRVNAAMVDERVELDLLFKQLKATNPGTEERKKLVEELTNKYPDLLEGYDLEIMKAKELDGVQKMLIKNIRSRITAEIKQDKAKELLKEAEEAKSKSALALNLWTNDQKYEYIRGLESQAEKLIGQSVESKGSKNSAQEVTGEVVTDAPVTTTTNLGTPKGYTKPAGETKERTSGAGEVKRIDVRIENLVKELNINTTNLKEGMGEIRKQVSEAIIAGVRDFEVAI